jgi:hypothetical protein
MNGALITLALIVGLPYLVMPLVILFAQKMDANPRLLPLLAAEIPAEALPRLKGDTEALQAVGFAPEAYLSMPQQMPNMRVFLVMLTDRARGDKAMVTTILTKPADGPPQLTSYVEFSTRFADGRLVDTMNSKQVGSFNPMPGEIKTGFTGMTDLGKLHQLHRYIIEKEIGSNTTPVVYPLGEAESYLRDVLIKGYDEQVGTGVLRLDRPAGVYRPSLIGAFKMTYRELPPLKQMLIAKRNTRARKILADFERERG